MIGRTLAHYHIVDRIGAGGMGEVYRAEDLRLERLVAIKLVSNQLREDRPALDRLLREARAASALNHPNIVTIYAVEETEETAFLAMELVEGESLRDRIDRGAMDLEALLRLGAEVADALEVAHAAGIIHRDIKPSNILITPRGNTKVLDFGVAKRVEDLGPPRGRVVIADQDRTVTITGLAGTAAYMSPEQVRGDAIDARSDLFALGCVLYEVATGAPAFCGSEASFVLRAIETEEPPNVQSVRNDLPESLGSVIARAMAKDRDLRFASAAEMAAALRAIPIRGPGGPGNVPGSVASFIGREREIAEIVGLLEGGRCVTLLGSGGCGKSRLAVEAASNRSASLPGGVRLVELAALGDPALLVQTVAAALGVRETPERGLLDAIEDSLRDRDLLLLLDNCEHLLPACAAFLTRILEGCPRVRVLATSREPIGLAGEIRWRVPSLTLPAPQDEYRVEDLSRFESVRLFVNRARALGSGFELTSANAQVVAKICRRLDGIPLAIELAAARMRVLPVAQILSRLEDCFRILSGGERPGLPRHQTLRGTVDWSYAMLTDPEHILFDRLSVFSGGMSLEAAESICAAAPLAPEEILDLLSHLVDKSLVVPEEGPGGDARYRLLEPLRQYGRERLLERGERDVMIARHTASFAALAERVEPELEGPEQAAWLKRLEVDHDNLRLAIQSAIDAGDAEHALSIAASIWRFWWVRGYITEGRARLHAILAMPGAERRDALRARALVGAGRMNYEQGEFGAARAHHEEALEIRRGLEDRPGEAMSLVNLGIVANGESDHARARQYYQASLAIQQELGNRRGEAICLNNLADLAYELGDLDESGSLFARSLEIRGTLGDRRGMAISLNGLGSVALHRGALGAAREYYGRSLSIHRELGDRPGVAESLLSNSVVAATGGDPEEARRLIREAMKVLRDVGDRLKTANAIDACLIVASVESDPIRVLRLAGLGRAYRAMSGFPRTPADERRIREVMGRAERTLGPERAAAALAGGSSLSLEEALEETAGGHASRTGQASGLVVG
jgi:non-specific serine/threonine protein kinase